MKYFKKILSLVIVVIILLGTVVPSLQPSFAATSNVFTPAFTYNSETGKWDISWTPITGSTSYTVIYHEPDDNGDVKEVITEPRYTADTINEQNVLSLTLLPDHIYDFEFSFENGGSKVSFKNKYDELVESETTFFIADITFRGTSFDDQGGLLDEGYETSSDDQGKPVTRIISGHKPRITFRWKVPTIYDSKIDEFIY
ncbi:MAG TPA: S-layer protein, partial [Thermoclostridium sp.]|nr:S-layer protein [Thermoclostridium sp.]